MAAAMTAFHDPNFSPEDKRFAALRGLPTPVASDEMFSMFIPAKCASATFTDNELFDSLSNSDQPALWISAKPQLRDFKKIKNNGIRFLCTDRDLCARLGGLTLTLCGKPHKIRSYSQFAHLYWVELSYIPDLVSDGDIYDYFAARDAPPYLIQASYDKNSLVSRHRTVHFNATRPPIAS